MIWTNVKMIALLYLVTLLSGCVYGQCIEGPCSLERERMIKSIKAYIEYWEKEGMTETSRLQDWLACGGQENGNFSLKTKDRLHGESDEDAQTRQEFAFQRCMLERNYHYTGHCTSEYMRARPLCGAP